MVTEVRADHESEWAAMNKVPGLLGIGSGETVR
jgi:transposase